jgi:hypothetical protein
MTKELKDWESQLRLEIARATGSAPEVAVPEKPVKAKKKFARRVVLGLSNDRGHTITEFVHESTHYMELPAELEARKVAKSKGLTVHSVVSNTKLK